MAITVRFFASLRESLNISENKISPEHEITVANAWELATEGKTMPINTLAAINMDYVDTSHNVKDGDEVAFFPPVTGG